jgi:hypothetical protein
LRDIAAGKGDSSLLGGIQKTIEELINPALWKIDGQGKGKKRCEGLAAHGRDVRESASQAAVADRVCGMPLAAEMYAFQRKIGGDESLRAGEGGEHGAIVADRLENAGRSSAARSRARRFACAGDAFDETSFGNRHNVTAYLKKRPSGSQEGQ